MARIKASSSTNWSGYVALTSLTNPLSNSVTNVFGSWTVPTISKSSVRAFCSIWVGMDGYSNGTAEQIGTEQEWTKGKQVNYAWFEMYPGPLYHILGFPVHKNDRVGGQVQFVRTTNGTTTFQLTVFNYTKCVWWTAPSQYTQSKSAQRNSAEWIVEAPSSTLSGSVLPLAHFSPITFANCQANIQNVIGGINDAHWVNDAITMKTTKGVVKAVPSNLSTSGKSFTVTWKHQ